MQIRAHKLHALSIILYIHSLDDSHCFLFRSFWHRSHSYVVCVGRWCQYRCTHTYVHSADHLDTQPFVFNCGFFYPEAESSKLNIAFHLFLFKYFADCVHAHSISHLSKWNGRFCNSNPWMAKKDKIALQTMAHRSDGAQLVRWKWW